MLKEYLRSAGRIFALSTALGLYWATPARAVGCEICYMCSPLWQLYCCTELDYQGTPCEDQPEKGYSGCESHGDHCHYGDPCLCATE